MKTFSARRSNRLLFRTYAIIVGGLMVMAAAFDLGFSRLQEPIVATPREWVDGTLTLLEARLAELPAQEWPTAVGALEERLGFPVKILPMDDVVQAGEPQPGTQEVFDGLGRSAFFRASSTLNAGIQIGPLAASQPPEGYLIDLIPALFYLSILVFVSLWLWPLLRDVNLLTNAASRFASDYRSPMSTREKTTTLKDLATSFDEMAARVRGLIEGQKELASALSHEIRTPLARIKFATAVIGDAPGTPAELQSIGQDVEEIDRLVRTMLDYARLDRRDMEMSWQLTPIGAWLEQVAARSRSYGPELRIECDEPEASAEMDPHFMELAVSNLVANASRYADKSIALRFEMSATHYLLSVDDDGPGIPEVDREIIFEAFTRLDDSRSRETGGYGLGLAIVARIAALHGGSAKAERSDLGGTRIVLTWPLNARSSGSTPSGPGVSMSSGASRWRRAK